MKPFHSPPYHQYCINSSSLIHSPEECAKLQGLLTASEILTQLICSREGGVPAVSLQRGQQAASKQSPSKPLNFFNLCMYIQETTYSPLIFLWQVKHILYSHILSHTAGKDFNLPSNLRQDGLLCGCFTLEVKGKSLGMPPQRP